MKVPKMIDPNKTILNMNYPLMIWSKMIYPTTLYILYKMTEKIIDVTTIDPNRYGVAKIQK